ncbi:MAG: HEAT repeat domain-containing protein [Clostridiales bacterium]|nr:HEAT repeat domain-containing protein [Clostridiales bacterium]
MTESELYKELGILTKDKDKWKESIPYVSSFLAYDSVKIQAKALWLLGEMGLIYSLSVQDVIPVIVSFLDSPVPLLRERAVNALGRIGRGSYPVIESYWLSLFRFASDKDAKVRLSFIWASENIATNTPDIYKDHMPVFETLLHDDDDKVRMEAPEMFRVLGKRRPEFVIPYLAKLQQLSQTDDNDVVRIHCLGAVKATEAEIYNVDEDIHDPCLRFQK